jgi:integrase
VSAVVNNGEKWIRGITWQEIDENLVLRHVTSKKQKETEVDLKLAPMVLEELRELTGGLPLVDDATKKVNRSLLPASGPVIVCDTTGWPWTAPEWRRKWRKVASACGIPNNVWNMDSRSGAISEAIAAGVPLEFVRHAATHSDIAQTQEYDRVQAKATAKTMKARVENRNKPAPE